MQSDEKAKILVVDDLPENLVVYRAILEELGEALVLVHSGEEALREVLREEFAVILLDVNMPGLDGLETAALIRARRKSAHTPIIFLTAFSDDVRVTDGYAHGAVDFISAPVVPAILRAKVKVFVELFRLTQQIRRHADIRVAHAEERSKREAAEEANRRLSFLARAGAIITKSLDHDVTIASILGLLTPEHAERAVLAERDEAGRWRATLGRSGDAESAVQPVACADLPAAWQEALERVAVAGATVHESAAANGSAARGEHLLAIPLCDRGRVFGVLLLTRGAAASGYAPADVAMYESIAWRSAIALVNARLYTEIEHAHQQKNRFLSMLAHELRNPLAPIRSAVDVLRLCGDSRQDIDWARDVIGRQVTHLVRLVDDLLDVSRMTLGKIRLQPELLDATELAAAAAEISQPLIDKGGHRFERSVCPGPVWLLADRARLTQVLSNLLNNAAKYTPPGGRISLSLLPEGDAAVFRVRDTGIGIPAPMLDKVFDMFVQIESGIDRAQGGLGIGLTLVRELVAMHRGTISVASDGPGAGAEFVVRIPLASPPRTDPATACVAAQA